MSRQLFFFDQPRRFVVGTVGQPGERVFFLQVSDHGRLVSVALEKAQVTKIKLKLQGNGYVVKQFPAAGGRWIEDGTLVLNLQG